MKVLLVGGGSGGHITPLLAVAHKLRQARPTAKITYVLEKGNRFVDLPKSSRDLNGVYQIRAGKFRRYHGESFWSHVFDVKTNLLNFRDLFYTIAGFFQSLRLLGRLRPDVVFIKGGFIGVPVGYACRVRGIPYFTHDSDTVPGLANRIIAKKAVYHAVGMPEEFYKSPKSKLRYTGIPLGKQYSHVSVADKQAMRRSLGLPKDSLVLAVTGGSLGAERLNKAFIAIVPSLLDSFDNLYILHQTGSLAAVYQALSPGHRERVRETAFTDELATFTGAADLVLTRAGATTIAELAVQGKAIALVPGSQLAGGQQTKNAEYLAKHQAAVVISEAISTKPSDFEMILSGLLRSESKRQELAKNLSKLAKPEAAEALTAIIEELAINKK